MHSSLALSICLLPAALAHPHIPRDSGLLPKHYKWAPPGDGDVRAPCPILNTLANHDFFPHNGRNITLDKAITALGDALHMTPALAETFFKAGLPANPLPNATWFDYDMLMKHNLVEKDGSLSRADMHFDPSNKFDPETFDSFLSYFGNSSMLSVNATSNARTRHVYDMSKINPEFKFKDTQLGASLGENGMMLLVWGSVEEPGANREYYEYFFRNERLPVELGWTPGTDIDLKDLAAVREQMIAAAPSDVPQTF